MNITMEGMPIVLDTLDGASEQIMDALEKTMAKACAVVEQDAKSNVPFDTGELRGSIHFSVKRDAATVTGEVTASKEYAVYVEFGTGVRGNEGHEGTDPRAKPTYTLIGKKGKPYMGRPAHPYLYPAYAANRAKIEQMFADAVKSAVGGE